MRTASASRPAIGLPPGTRRGWQGGPAVSPQGTRVPDSSGPPRRRNRAAGRFLLVGDGILTDNCLAQIRERGLDDYFQLTGLVPPSRIPSNWWRPWTWSFTRAFAKASLASCPRRSPENRLSATMSTAAREVVIPGQTGFLLPPKSIDAARRDHPACPRPATSAGRSGAKVAANLPTSFGMKK